MNKELPEGWTLVELGKVCHVIMGQSPPSDTYNDKRAGLPFFQGKAEFTELYPIVKKWCSNPNKIAEPNDILLSVRAPVGATNIANQTCCIGRGLAAVRYPNYKYIFYFLRLNEKELDKKGTGTTFRAISGETVRTLPTPIPPPDEEARIVEKIEELFSELDKGIENLKIAQQQLKVYRQAVLKWAFEGKLTKNDKDWEEVKLGKVAYAIDPQPSHRTPPKADKGIPFVSTKDFDHDTDTIVFDHARIVSSTVLEEHLLRYELQLGDFVIGKIGTIGKPVRVVLPQNYALSANIVLIQPRKVNPTYLYYFFQSSLMEKAFLAGQSATSQAAFGIQKVRELDIRLPSDREQLNIVQEIESRLSVCDKMEETITASLQQAEALRQSILKRAFEGKLVKAKTPINEDNAAFIIDVDNDNWRRKVVTGNIIFSFQRGGYVGRTKLQKMLYLVEQYAELDYKTDYIKEAAGPLDSKFLYAFLNEAKQKNWVEETPIGNGYKYEPSTAISQLTKEYAKYFRSKSEKITFVIKLLKEKDTDTSELIATIYAIWNNYIIGKEELTNELLVKEVYDWDESKIKFDKRLILSTWQWMKDEGLVPVGFGKLINKAA